MTFARSLLLLACCTPALTAAEHADPVKLAAAIDARLAEGWKKGDVKPVGGIDDATFLRRATLDLVGRIPSVAESRSFLGDKSPDKRPKLLLRLIESGGHTRHMATFWRRTWVPQADTAQFARVSDDFERWLSSRLQENTAYDTIVKELVALPAIRTAGVSPSGFYEASEGKPENLAANVARSFMGVNLDCAQCHDHPFARWTRDQFWQTAAFFAPPVKDKAGKLVPAELAIPNTKKVLAPAALIGKPIQWPEVVGTNTGRELFAAWLIDRENPFFATNAVNRLWAQIYGTALVEPLDDIGGDAATNAYYVDLLNELAQAFVASGYDLKFLTRALVLTKAYQLASLVGDEEKPTDLRYFARMPVRGLTGEQLYDSLRTAAGLPSERDDTGRGLGLAARKRFAAQFHIERSVSAERSMVQALSMMNGRTTADLTDYTKNPTLAGASEAPFLDTRGKVETLFFAALGRKPTEKEANTLVEYVTNGGSETDPRRALGDIFWALVNSTEFNTNH